MRQISCSGAPVRVRGGEVIRGITRWAVPLALLAAACSSEMPAVDGTGGASPGAIGGAGGAATGPTCVSPQPSCVTTCSSATARTAPVCRDDGSWACPAGSSDATACPAGSCADVSTRYCCDPTTGQIFYRTCGADGFYPACPAGQTASSYYCAAPEASGNANCAGLAAQACPVVGHECNAGAEVCTCVASGDASPMWFCQDTLP
jgi:hypothetical protein